MKLSGEVYFILTNSTLLSNTGTGKILSVRNSVVDPYTVQIYSFNSGTDPLSYFSFYLNRSVVAMDEDLSDDDSYGWPNTRFVKEIPVTEGRHIFEVGESDPCAKFCLEIEPIIKDGTDTGKVHFELDGQFRQFNLA